MTDRSHASHIARTSTLLLALGLAGCGDDGTAISATDVGTTDPGTTTAPLTTTSPTTTAPPPTTTDAPTTGSTTDDTTTAVTVTDSTTSTTTGPDDTTTGPDDTTTTGPDDTTTTTGPDDTTTTGPDATCEDGVQNQDESDIDCGGASCSPCALGQTCNDHPDCLEGACVDGVCAMVDCLVDADCDGQDGACVDAACDLLTFTCTLAPINEAGECDDGDLCSATSVCTDGACVAAELVDCSALDGECSEGACNPEDGECLAIPVNEAGACDDGDLCSTTSVCTEGACVTAELVDCSALDGACSEGTCNPDDGQCQAAAVNEGLACDDGNACTADTTCLAGVCGDPNTPVDVFFEDFADNDAGWTFDANWAIGGAVAGCGDPGVDHTATDDNGIAGVVLGDCAPQVIHDYLCLTSPTVDTTGLPSVNLGYWRDLYSDYTPYMKNKVEVWDGNTWNIVFETFGSPGVNDAAWQNLNHDITGFSNPALQVRWCYNIDSAGVFARGSWNLDDIVISEAACNP